MTTRRRLFQRLFIIALTLGLMIGLFTGKASAQWALVTNEQNVIVTASSYCDEYEDINFSPDQAFNQRPDRPWMSARDFDPKKPEWIKMTFTTPARIAALRIVPGFGRDEYYDDFARLKKFQLELDRGDRVEKRTYYRFFDSDPHRDMVILFSNNPSVKSITLRILDIYPGSKSKYPLVGNLEPVIVTSDRIISTSWALEDAISFLKSARNPDSAFDFVPRQGGMVLSRGIRNSNPLDDSLSIARNERFDRQALQSNREVWDTLCLQISTDYQFNSFQAVSYIWKDHGSGNIMFDFTPSPVADTTNYYTLALTRQRVTETVTRDGEETQVSVLRAVVNNIRMVSEVYTP